VLSAVFVAHAQKAPFISVDQRIEAATRELGYFQRDHYPEEFESALLTISEINNNAESGAPLSSSWEVRELEIKDTLSTWFLIFRTLDSMKATLPKEEASRCRFNISPAGGYVGMAPEDVSDTRERAAYRKQLSENMARCERQKLEMLLPHLQANAETSFRNALNRFVAIDNATGSHFAYALGKSALSSQSSRLMWEMFGHLDQKDWQPSTSYSLGYLNPSLTENAKPADVDKHILQWLGSSDPREVAWGAYFAARDTRQRAVPTLLAYVHRHAYDPLFETGADVRRSSWPEVESEVDAMHAVLVALIDLHATVPADDLLQIAPVQPNFTLMLAALPSPQEHVLMNIFLAGGFKPLGRGEYYSRAGAKPSELGELMRWTAAGNIWRIAIPRNSAAQFLITSFYGLISLP
jgi:hypothetical protein